MVWPKELMAVCRPDRISRNGHEQAGTRFSASVASCCACFPKPRQSAVPPPSVLRHQNPFHEELEHGVVISCFLIAQHFFFKRCVHSSRIHYNRSFQNGLWWPRFPMWACCYFFFKERSEPHPFAAPNRAPHGAAGLPMGLCQRRPQQWPEPHPRHQVRHSLDKHAGASGGAQCDSVPDSMQHVNRTCEIGMNRKS